MELLDMMDAGVISGMFRQKGEFYMTQKKKQGWFSCLLEYAAGSRGKLALSTAMSVISVL